MTTAPCTTANTRDGKATVLASSFSMSPSIPDNGLTRAGNGDAQKSPSQKHHVQHSRSSSSSQPRSGANCSTREALFRNESGLSIVKGSTPRGQGAEPTTRASPGIAASSLSRYNGETTSFKSHRDIGKGEIFSPTGGDLGSQQKPENSKPKAVKNSPKHSSVENRANLNLQDFRRVITKAAKMIEDKSKAPEAAKLILDAMLWDGIKKLPRDNFDVVVARHHLGECYFYMENYGEAETLYRQVLKARKSQKPPDPSKVLGVRQDLAAALIKFAEQEKTRDTAKAEKLNFEALTLATESMNEKNNIRLDEDIDNVLHCTDVLLENQNRKPLELAKLNRSRVRALVKIGGDMSDEEVEDMKFRGIAALKLFTVDLKDRKRGYEVYNTVESRIRKYGAQDADQSAMAAHLGDVFKNEWRKATGLLARKRWKKCLEKVRAGVRRDVLPRKKEIRERWHLICRRLTARQRWRKVLSNARVSARRTITCRRRQTLNQWNSLVQEVLQKKRKEEEEKSRKKDEEQKRLKGEEEKKRNEETRARRLDEAREKKKREKDLMNKRKEEEQASKRVKELEEEEALNREKKTQEDLEIQQGISRADTGCTEWSGPETPLSLDTGPAFFDSEAVLDSIQNSEKWIKDFIRSRDMIISPRHDKNMERVRVTIIDTGLDKTHPFVTKRQWQDFRQAANKKVALFQDFVTEKPSREAIDEDGHGTFIAGVVLQLAPLVELSIARVATTRASLMKDPDAEGKVTKAIDHAITEWDTDIISMSFGFRLIKTPGFRAAISRATSKNKILCAAAGNFGNSEANLSFPARLSEVFKIFATDHQGGKCSFSPRPGVDRDFCFSILGHDVASIWPETLRDKDKLTPLKVVNKRNPKKYPGLWVAMSGTSFATPIAASVISILYQFYDANKAEINLEPALEFKTVEAVRAILLKMSMAPTADQHNFLNPWVGRDNYFNFSGEEKSGSVSFFAQMLRLCLGAWNK
ncbi:thermostable alkaline protease [Colletotrichum orchidophilum]|uniref:Thermostable alkaline protease n=1 Tax=Colletotrichum orchidophilum TaxID=1209926 RepID=A0A1G4BNV7_9PEZI|nr:thermostable alkaline protease [Colletotrichum orchidophilum]OHF03140.1 thermostable alkaline protease [Colletotrichum orchidophilum]